MAFRYGQVELNVQLFTRTYKYEAWCRSEMARIIQYNVQLNYIYFEVYAFRDDRPKDAIHSEMIELEIQYTVQVNVDNIYLQIWSNACGFHFEFHIMCWILGIFIVRLNIIWIANAFGCESILHFETRHVFFRLSMWSVEAYYTLWPRINVKMLKNFSLHIQMCV